MGSVPKLRLSENAGGRLRIQDMQRHYDDGLETSFDHNPLTFRVDVSGLELMDKVMSLFLGCRIWP